MGKIEIIDFIEDQKLGFHLGNAVKYIARAQHKGNEKEDIEKAIWYLNRYLSLAKDAAAPEEPIARATGHHGMERNMRNTICFDLDGVIADFYHCSESCDYTRYPNTKLHRSRCPVTPGIVKILTGLKEKGYRIIIWTGRVERERTITEKWLHNHNIPCDELIMDKPRAMIYVDDFGYRFDGDAAKLLDFIVKVERVIG